MMQKTGNIVSFQLFQLKKRYLYNSNIHSNIFITY